MAGLEKKATRSRKRLPSAYRSPNLALRRTRPVALAQYQTDLENTRAAWQID